MEWFFINLNDLSNYLTYVYKNPEPILEFFRSLNRKIVGPMYQLKRMIKMKENKDHRETLISRKCLNIFPVWFDSDTSKFKHLINWTRIVCFFKPLIQLLLSYIGLYLCIDCNILNFILWSSFHKFLNIKSAFNSCKLNVSNF